MRCLMADFVRDLLPTWYAREVLRASFTYGRKSRARTCFLGKRTVHGDACGEEQLKIALLAEPHINELSRSAWVHSILQRVPGRPHVQLPPPKNKLVCFKSIVAYRRNSILRTWNGWYGPKHRFYTFNNVSRESTLTLPPPEKGQPCAVRVLLLNRLGWLNQGEWRVGRDITNSNDVKETIEKMGKRRGYAVEVEEATFEGASFGEQIAAMQRADIVLAAHGSALANMLFARFDTGIVEAFPFGYRPDGYSKLTAALNLKHRAVIAEPDFKYVLECTAKKAKLYKDDNIRARGQRTWLVAVDQWRAGLRSSTRRASGLITCPPSYDAAYKASAWSYARVRLLRRCSMKRNVYARAASTTGACRSSSSNRRYREARKGGHVKATHAHAHAHEYEYERAPYEPTTFDGAA